MTSLSDLDRYARPASTDEAHRDLMHPLGVHPPCAPRYRIAMVSSRGGAGKGTTASLMTTVLRNITAASLANQATKIISPEGNPS